MDNTVWENETARAEYWKRAWETENMRLKRYLQAEREGRLIIVPEDSNCNRCRMSCAYCHECAIYGNMSCDARDDCVIAIAKAQLFGGEK